MKYDTNDISLAPGQEALFFTVGSLYDHLENLTDHRDPHGIRYPLAVALVFIILAKLAGEQEPRGIAQWIELRKELLKEALQFDRDQCRTQLLILEYLARLLTWQSFRAHFCSVANEYQSIIG